MWLFGRGFRCGVVQFGKGAWQSGERTAAIFYTAYVTKGADAAKRPLTFVFNGGPGAASAYLHLGLVGPRIIDFGYRIPIVRISQNGFEQIRNDGYGYLADRPPEKVGPIESFWAD